MINNKKLHIIHSESSCGWGGQEIRILTESQGMVERGHTVTIVCPEEAPIFTEAKERGIQVESLPIAKKTIRGVIATSKWLKNINADIINTHSSTDSWMMALAKLWLKYPAPIIRTRHVSAPVNKGLTTKWLYTKAAAHIATTGEQLKQTLVTDNNFPPSMITSVPTGINRQIFHPGNKNIVRSELGLPTDKIIIGIVATLRSWKGHDYLFEAFAKLDNPDTHLLVVGDGPRAEHLKQLSTQLGIENKMTMPGNQKVVAPWMQAMDLFALPSYANEGVPQGLMQAMLCGLPVITTHVGSIAEIVEHNNTGIIIPPKDAQALSNAISQLVSDHKKRDIIADNGLNFGKERFCIEIMLDKMEEIFYNSLTN